MSDWTTRIENADIGDDVLKDLVQKVVHKSWAYDLALAAIDVSEGRKPVEVILSQMEKLEVDEVDEGSFITDDLEELYDKTIQARGLRWRLDSLNKSLGSLRKGDFGFIFARPETGKTTFLASEVTNFAGQVQSPILWFNNEEQGRKVKIRCYQAALGVDLTGLFSSRESSRELYQEKTNGNILIPDLDFFNRVQVEQLCKQTNPSLVVFDQLDKVAGFTEDREDLRLGGIYIWARELAKQYCPVIGVCQSDASGEGRKWLKMDNVANAKTSKQAEADWIIGIGCQPNMGYDHVRYLNIVKNKLLGDEDTNPAQRHGQIECMIEPTIARYKDF